MSYFEKANLLVLPVQVSEHNGEKIKYPNYNPNYKPGGKPFPMGWQGDNSKNWVSWEEREDVYPGVKDWFALGGLVTRDRYFMDGMEIGYGVIDVDNHGDKEKFDKTVAFLSSIGWDDTLIVQTPSGGRHYYFWGVAEYLPNHSNGCEEYAIEFKTRGGWLCPNGRDRIIISDKPIKRLSLTKDSPFASLASVKKKTSYRPRRPTNPNFDIEAIGFPKVGKGERHDTLIKMMNSLYSRGCPPDKMEKWGREFFRQVNRVEEPNEISNAVRDAINHVENSSDRNTSHLIELKQEIEQEPRDPIQQIFPGAVELDGWDKTFALTVFSDREESKQLIKEKLATIPPEDKPKLRGLITNDLSRMQETWATLPPELQHKYEGLKDAMKLLQGK